MSEVNQEEDRSEVDERDPQADEMNVERNWAGALRRERMMTRASRRSDSERERRVDLVGRKKEGSMKRKRE
jgi:hypothetical protein